MILFQRQIHLFQLDLGKMRFYKTIEDDLGILYAKPKNHRLDPDGHIIADFTIVMAPADLEKEIGKFNSYKLKDMEVLN